MEVYERDWGLGKEIGVLWFLYCIERAYSQIAGDIALIRHPILDELGFPFLLCILFVSQIIFSLLFCWRNM